MTNLTTSEKLNAICNYVFYILGKSELENDRLSVEDNYAEFRFSKQFYCIENLYSVFYKKVDKS